ncbi:hypothetical protein KK083_07995 [Fulvivirgaceae bacterium PWU4]|uniref:Lipocalin-like domain-containing protein n=1 Tax=Chryseosolibacter histidini TaxID=2782349 RepID=A0AAP2DML4_9BACT|nr:hypothetical protein [Chryseosolibacter histidini]MBT1696809.1 hypothetical protein [Chryseosolibacter histidini]
MKKKSTFCAGAVIALVVFSVSAALAQPGDPPSCTAGQWNLSASAATVSNGGQVSIYAVYQAGGCPKAGTITVNKTSTFVSATPSLPVNPTIPECINDPDAECQTSGQILVGTFTLTHSQTSASQITFQITGITGGHTAGSSVVVTVNP